MSLREPEVRFDPIPTEKLKGSFPADLKLFLSSDILIKLLTDNEDLVKYFFSYYQTQLKNIKALLSSSIALYDHKYKNCLASKDQKDYEKNLNKLMKKKNQFLDIFKKTLLSKSDLKVIQKLFLIFENIRMTEFDKQALLKALNSYLRFKAKRIIHSKNIKYLYENYYKLVFSCSEFIFLHQDGQYSVYFNEPRIVIINTHFNKVVCFIPVSEVPKSVCFIRDFSTFVYHHGSAIIFINLKEFSLIKYIENLDRSKFTSFFIVSNELLVSSSIYNIELINIENFTIIHNISNLEKPQFCCKRLVFEDKILFHDSSKIYSLNIHTKNTEVVLSVETTIHLSLLMNDDKYLVLFLSTVQYEMLEIRDAHNLQKVYTIMVYGCNRYLYSYEKARIFLESNLIIFKTHVFDVKQLKFITDNRHAFGAKSDFYKKIINTKNGIVYSAKYRENICGSVNIIMVTKENDKIITIKRLDNQTYIEIFTIKSRKITKQQLGNTFYMYHSLQGDLISMFHDCFILFWNLQTEKIQKYFNCLNVYSDFILSSNGKYMFTVYQNSLFVYLIKMINIEVHCEVGSLPLYYSCQQRIITSENNELSSINTENLEQSLLLSVGYIIEVLKYINDELLLAIGRYKFFIFDLNKNEIIIQEDLESSINKISLKVFIIKKFLIFYDDEKIILLKKFPFLSKTEVVENKESADYYVGITENLKYFVYFSTNYISTFNIKTSIESKILFQGQNIKNSYYIKLISPKFFVIAFKTPKRGLEICDHNTSCFSGNSCYEYEILVLNIKRSTYQITAFLSQPFILFEESKHLILAIDGKYFVFDLCLSQFTELSINHFSVYQVPNRSYSTSNFLSQIIKKSKFQNFVWNYDFGRISFLKFSVNKKRLFLSGKNYHLIIINLKHSYIEAIFIKSLIKSIKEIHEFRREKMLILMNSKKIIKFSMKDFSHKIIHKANFKIQYYKFIDFHYLCITNRKPNDVFICIFYDILNERRVELEQIFRIDKIKILKFLHFLVIYYISEYHQLNKTKGGIFIVDIGMNELVEFSIYTGYRYSSSNYPFSKKSTIRKHFQLVPDKNITVFQYHCSLYIIDTNSFAVLLNLKNIKINFSSGLCFSENRRYLALGTNTGPIYCYDVLAKKTLRFCPHSSAVSFLCFIQDKYLLSYASKARDIIKNRLNS